MLIIKFTGGFRLARGYASCKSLIDVKNMNFLDLIWHLAGFVAPALSVALGVAVADGIITKKSRFSKGLVRQFGLNFAVGLAVLLGGLILTGRDGRMLTYAALVVAVATSQLLFGRRA